MLEILAPRSFKWYMVCSCTMLSCWENSIQTSALQTINILAIWRKKSKTLISQQLSWAGKFSPWFCDLLGPTHHLIPLTQNVYVKVALSEMDPLLRISMWNKWIYSDPSLNSLFQNWCQNAIWYAKMSDLVNFRTPKYWWHQN